MTAETNFFADSMISKELNNDLVPNKNQPIYINKYIINLTGRERLQEGGILYWKFLKSPPLNRTINNMFQGIFRHEDLCCILKNSQILKDGVDTKMIILYNKMLYLYDPIIQYVFDDDDETMKLNEEEESNDMFSIYYKLTQAKICANLRPYGISSILCDSTGRLSKPILETNSAYIQIQGLINDDKNAYSTNDTLRLPSSKIIPSSTEIPAFDKKSVIGTLFAVLVSNSKNLKDLTFDINFIATKNISINNYCLKRSLPFVQLGTFRCLELADNNKDIYKHTPSNHSEEYTYFPNFVFNCINEWVLPSNVIPYSGQYHEILSLLHNSTKVTFEEEEEEELERETGSFYLNGNIYYSKDRYMPVTFISDIKSDPKFKKSSILEETDYSFFNPLSEFSYLPLLSIKRKFDYDEKETSSGHSHLM